MQDNDIRFTRIGTSYIRSGGNINFEDIGGTPRNLFAGGYFYGSDASLKENIQPIEGALGKVLQLEGVSFNWKDSGEASIGLIAQNVEDIFPHAVSTDAETGLKSIKADSLIAPVIEAIKELFERQNEQQVEIDELKLKIEELEARLDGAGGSSASLETVEDFNQALQCLPQ